MNKLPLTFVGALAIAVAMATPGLAQQPPEDPVSTARIRLGPLGVTPSLSITNLGVDSNVFREEVNPRQDVTATVSPAALAWVRAGRSVLSIETRADMAYFERYATERSVDYAADGRYEIRANRLTPWVGARYATGRQRVGYEIDARSQRTDREARAGLQVQLGGKTAIDLSGRRTDYSYDADARFLGTSLHEVLNRRSESAAISLSQRVTPITTAFAIAESTRDRFALAEARNADSVRVLGGLNLAPLALVSGTVRAGYRSFVPRDGAPFKGLVGSAHIAYTLVGRTRFDLLAERDLNYSFELASPHYVLTGGDLTVTPRLSTHWDVQARGGRHQLVYRDAAGASTRTDQHMVYGAGLGYRVGSYLRLGANIDRERRTSDAQSREYEGYKMGVSMTYGR
jgi:hypothetical protein